MIRPIDKKSLILQILIQEKEPQSLSALFEVFGQKYSKRSIRRWLDDLIKEGSVAKLGHTRGAKYKLALAFVPQEPSMAGSLFGAESKKVIEQIRRPLYERKPVAYSDEWLEAYNPGVTFYISPNLRMQLHEAGKRSQREEPAGTYAHQIFNRLLIDLSYNSSRLEGNTYSLLDTQRLLLGGKSAAGKLNEEKIMILNHKEAIRYLVDGAPRLETNIQSICTLHYLLSDGLIEARYGGKIRDYGIRIGGSTYVPIEDPQKLRGQLDLIAKKAALIRDPYEQSIFLLIHLSYLQAFVDVNKRTARLSANIPLIKNNLVPLSFNDVDKEDYISSVIAVYELQEIQPIIDLYCFSYLRTCAMYDATVKTIGYDEIRVRYRAQRRALIKDIILKKLVDKKLEKYIVSLGKKLIDEKDRPAFIVDILEDLREIDQNRIAGLGVTPEQLSAWFKEKSCIKNAE